MTRHPHTTTTATDHDKRIIDAVSVALAGIIGQDDDIDRLYRQINGGQSTDKLRTACKIAVAFIRFAQDLKARRCSRVIVPTEEGGVLTLEAEQLLAARVSTLYETCKQGNNSNILEVVIRWHDDGQVGHPEIEVNGDTAEVRIRRKKKVHMLDRPCEIEHGPAVQRKREALPKAPSREPKEPQKPRQQKAPKPTHQQLMERMHK